VILYVLGGFGERIQATTNNKAATAVKEKRQKSSFFNTIDKRRSFKRKNHLAGHAKQKGIMNKRIYESNQSMKDYLSSAE